MDRPAWCKNKKFECPYWNYMCPLRREVNSFTSKQSRRNVEFNRLKQIAETNPDAIRQKCAKESFGY